MRRIARSRYDFGFTDAFQTGSPHAGAGGPHLQNLFPWKGGLGKIFVKEYHKSGGHEFVEQGVIRPAGVPERRNLDGESPFVKALFQSVTANSLPILGDKWQKRKRHHLNPAERHGTEENWSL